MSRGLELVVLGFPGGSDGKKSACIVGEPGFDPWVGKIPWRRAWQPTPVFLPGESQGHRSLEDCCPKRHKESDTTEHSSSNLRPREVCSHPRSPQGHSHRWQLPQWLGFASWAPVGPLRPPMILTSFVLLASRWWVLSQPHLNLILL